MGTPMTIKIGDTKIIVPQFIAFELNKKTNRKLFDNFLCDVLTAQGQRIRSTLKIEQNLFEKLLKGMGPWK
jgi:uncharacterized protein YaaW (UPF0174 family)